VSEHGALYACGDHRHGKLGLGEIDEDVLQPRKCKTHHSVRIRQASAWHSHSLAVSDTGRLYSFGCGVRGRLGHGNENTEKKPKKVQALKNTPIQFAAAGELHSCVRTVSGQAYAFGDSALGQTGSPLMADVVVTPTLVEGLGDSSVVEVAVGDHHTVVRLSTGALYTCGKNQEGQLGLGATGTDGPAVYIPNRVAWPTPERVR